MINKRKIGCQGEQLVAKYLKKQRVKILQTNYNCPVGEIDIVAMSNNTIIFVEVKSRSSTQFGLGREAVTLHKQRHIVRACQYYLLQNKLTGMQVRFDVAEVDLNTLTVEYIVDAFRP